MPPGSTAIESPPAPLLLPTRRTDLLPPRSSLARERIPLAQAALPACNLCLHRCAANRSTRPAGLCHAGPAARCFAAQTDVSDELELIPSFAISLSGCNLRCDFCITGQPSWNPAAGSPVHPSDTARLARLGIQRGARSIMILGGEPTLHIVTLLELVAELPDDVPLVLKTNAMFTEQARPLLAGLFDVWLPDLKFGNADCAQRLAAIPPSAQAWTTVTSNLIWMATHHPAATLIVRHLLMPGHVSCCWQPIARWLAHTLPDTKVSLRSGFWPAWHAHRHPELRTPLSHTELAQATRLAHDLHLRLVP